jgi:hypothetical protein
LLETHLSEVEGLIAPAVSRLEGAHLHGEYGTGPLARAIVVGGVADLSTIGRVLATNWLETAPLRRI